MFIVDSIRGGSPYGAGVFAGDGSREASETELALAEHQGKYMAGIVKRLAKSWCSFLDIILLLFVICVICFYFLCCQIDSGFFFSIVLWRGKTVQLHAVSGNFDGDRDILMFYRSAMFRMLYMFLNIHQIVMWICVSSYPHFFSFGKDEGQMLKPNYRWTLLVVVKPITSLRMWLYPVQYLEALAEICIAVCMSKSHLPLFVKPGLYELNHTPILMVMTTYMQNSNRLLVCENQLQSGFKLCVVTGCICMYLGFRSRSDGPNLKLDILQTYKKKKSYFKNAKISYNSFF